MNWREYERHLLQDLKDAKHNLDYTKEQYQQAIIYYQKLLKAKRGFDREIEKILGGK